MKSKLFPPALLLLGALAGAFAYSMWPSPRTDTSAELRTGLLQSQRLIEANARAIQSLREDMRAGIARAPGTLPPAPQHTAALDDRLAALEQSVQTLSRDFARGLPERTQPPSSMAGSGVRPDPDAQNAGRAMGEQAFEADMGPRLGFDEGALADSFRMADTGASLSEVQCRTSVCKVTYQPPPPQAGELRRPGQDDPDMVLRLMDSLDGNFELFHGRNDDGTNVMYLQATE